MFAKRLVPGPVKLSEILLRVTSTYSLMMPARRGVALVTAILLFPIGSAQAAVPDWPDLYDPFTVHTLNLELVNPSDLNTILHDTTYSIEVPAWFWADGDDVAPILISVRRKWAAAPNQKVSFKLDINEFKDDPAGASSWHGVKKLSLENGDDTDVVLEPRFLS